MMTIWHKRNEFPHGFTEENKLFVYVFNDGSTYIEEYCEQYHKDSDLKKWCVFNELCGLEKRLKQTKDLELDLRKKLQFAAKALELAEVFYSYCEMRCFPGCSSAGFKEDKEIIREALVKIEEQDYDQNQ